MRQWIWPASLVAVVTLTGCATSAKPAAKPPAVIHAKGSVSIPQPSDAVPSSPGARCSGGDGYDDITEGAQVVISDDAGTTLTIASLGAGVVGSTYLCQYPFAFDVPAGKAFYGVTVTHRGTVKEPVADMGDLALTIN